MMRRPLSSPSSQRARRDLVATLRVLVAAVACALVATPAAVGAPLFPDIVADPPVGGNRPVVHTDAEGSRLLLRLDGFVHNRGPGPLEIRGSNPSGGVMATVRQRVYDSGGGFTDLAHVPAPALIYETNDDHEHWHLRHAMRYSLWSEDRGVEVGPAQKVGFCLLDSERIEAPATTRPVYTESSDGYCKTRQPSAPSITMGVSAGWRDIYSYVLAFQWIDISDVAPGRYWLRADADPDGVIAETDEANPGAYDADASIVNGYRADPVAAGTVPALGSAPITLAATKFDDAPSGSPGPRQFQIVTPPAGGTLDRPAGTWFSGANVNYTPNPGFSGPDSFTVAARDASTPFPLNPRSAAVTLTVQGAGPATTPVPSGSGTPVPSGSGTPVPSSSGTPVPSGSGTPVPSSSGMLGISGAPQSLYTSSTAQLRASGPGAEQGVTWSVAGLGAAGTISAGGVYRAPASAPPGGVVAISARSATGATGQVVIGVENAPRSRAAPTIKTPPVPERGLSKIRLGRHNNSLIAVVSSAQSGRVRFAVRRNGTRVGFCSMVVRKRGAATCTVRITSAISRLALVCPIPRTIGLKLPGVTVTATLTRHGKIVATRHATAR